MNILYVEDNKINAMVMDRMLSKNGYSITLADNGDTALTLLPALQHPLDLILIDINLGINQMDGCELLQHFRKIAVLQATPMYAVTAYAMPGDAQRFLSVGFDQYFAKPVNFDKLLEAINGIKAKAS